MAAKKRGIERDVEEVFLSEVSRHGSVRKACKVAGVSREWLRTKILDESFAVEYADACEDSMDRLEDTAFAMALDEDEKMLRYLLDVKRYKKTTETDLGQVRPIINITIGN